MAETSCNYRSMLERILRDEGIPYRIALELGNPEAIKRSLSAGSGVVLLPRMAAKEEILRGEQLTVLPIRHPAIQLSLLLGLRPQKWISQPLRTFMEKI
ncbi:LysR family transcriptional regulator substrate-binding protein [Paenibacillus lupini]|nr:DNA-binding transcriptional LysR family regulator [Paenibacillus lupini]